MEIPPARDTGILIDYMNNKTCHFDEQGAWRWANGAKRTILLSRLGADCWERKNLGREDGRMTVAFKRFLLAPGTVLFARRNDITYN